MVPDKGFFKHELFSESYWQRPKSKNQGDAQSAPIYRSVGGSLTRWEVAEEELANLYLQLASVSGQSVDPVRRTFGSIESSAGRRSAVEAAAEAFFHEHWTNSGVQRSFRRLTKAMGFASKRRDDIAHGVVVQQRIDGRDYGFFLFPTDYNTGRTHLIVPEGDSDDPLVSHTKAKYRFTADQVGEFGAKFKGLRTAITTVSAILMGGPASFVQLFSERTPR